MTGPGEAVGRGYTGPGAMTGPGEAVGRGYTGPGTGDEAMTGPGTAVGYGPSWYTTGPGTGDEAMTGPGMMTGPGTMTGPGKAPTVTMVETSHHSKLVYGFAVIGIGFLLYGAGNHFLGKTHHYDSLV